MPLYRCYAANRNKRLMLKSLNPMPISQEANRSLHYEEKNAGNKLQKYDIMIHQRLLSWAGTWSSSRHHARMPAFGLRHRLFARTIGSKMSSGSTLHPYPSSDMMETSSACGGRGSFQHSNVRHLSWIFPRLAKRSRD